MTSTLIRTVGDLIRGQTLHSARTTMTLDQCLRTMIEFHVRRLPVLNDGGECIGIVTDRDLRLAAESPLLHHETATEVITKLAKHTVGEIMKGAVLTVEEDAPVVEAAKLMRVRCVGGLPVVRTGSNVVVGVCTRSDLLDHLIRQLEPEPLE